MLSLNKILFAVLTMCMFSAQALAEGGTCTGSFSFESTTVSVNLDSDWRAMTAALELDDTDGCKSMKDADDGFLCNGGSNLVTSLIDDVTASSTLFSTGLVNPWGASANATGPDAYAVVHMDIFQPGDCADLKVATCDLDGVPDNDLEDCYISESGKEFATAEESCADTYSFNGEGMFAAGNDLSTKRHPKQGNNKNWAMSVPLMVTEDCSLYDGTDQATCEGANNDVSALLIANGGGYGEVGASAPEDYLEVGTATFTPAGGCAWTPPVDETLDCPCWSDYTEAEFVSLVEAATLTPLPYFNCAGSPGADDAVVYQSAGPWTIRIFANVPNHVCNFEFWDPSLQINSRILSGLPVEQAQKCVDELSAIIPQLSGCTQ